MALRAAQDGLRGADTPARFGGDEFVVLCEDVADEQHVISIAERLQRAICEPFRIDAHELKVTSSMGIVVSDGHEDDADALIRNADEAMYRSKRQGTPTRCSTTACEPARARHAPSPTCTGRSRSASSGFSISRR